MKIINCLSLLVFLFIGNHFLYGQNLTRLKAEGKIPKEFITESTIKFKKEVKNLNKKKTKRKKRKVQKRFLLESGFAIDDILQSGLVLFNDPASNYVNKVLGNLPIKDRKLTRKNPRAYILNSSAVNAFATDQGIIFVTLGLLAKLENEAQLAFILAHELVHIKKRHSINKFVKSKEIDRNGQTNNVDKVGIDQRIFKKSMYSRKLEDEADEEGLQIFLQSDYDPKAILNTFKILHYSYLPFENIPFEKSFFEEENYRFPPHLWLDKEKEITPMGDSDEEDESASHPSSQKRLKKMEKAIESSNSEDKKAFILAEEEFRNIQTLARYQIPFLNLYVEDFSQAIYTSYALLQEYPNDLALKKVIGKALYMEAKYQNHYITSSQDREEWIKEILEHIEGASHRVYHLLGRLDQVSMTILALKYNWKLHQAAPEDEELQIVVDDLFIELANHYKKLDDFSTTDAPLDLYTEVTKSKEQEQSTKDSQDKITYDSNYDSQVFYQNERRDSFDLVAKHDSIFREYAFVQELKDPAFKAAQVKGLEEWEEREERIEYYESVEGRKKLEKANEKEFKKGKRLGIDKIAVINPFYLSLDARKGKGTQYIRSEEKQSDFRKVIKDLGKQSKVAVKVLDVMDLSSKNVEQFNEIATINNYFSQQMNHYELSLTPGFEQNEVNAIAEKYGTDYFLWTGVMSLRKDKKYAWFAVGYSVLIPFFTPFALGNALSDQYDMLYYAILFDVTTGRRSIIKMEYFNKKDSKTLLKAHVYDVFQQIGNKEK